MCARGASTVPRFVLTRPAFLPAKGRAQPAAGVRACGKCVCSLLGLTAGEARQAGGSGRAPRPRPETGPRRQSRAGQAAAVEDRVGRSRRQWPCACRVGGRCMRSNDGKLRKAAAAAAAAASVAARQTGRQHSRQQQQQQQCRSQCSQPGRGGEVEAGGLAPGCVGRVVRPCRSLRARGLGTFVFLRAAGRYVHSLAGRSKRHESLPARTIASSPHHPHPFNKAHPTAQVDLSSAAVHLLAPFSHSLSALPSPSADLLSTPPHTALPSYLSADPPP